MERTTRMMKTGRFSVSLILLAMAAACGREVRFSICPDLPDPIGRSGLYAAELDGSVIVAGGCNFPDKPVTEGGAKVCYDDIWLLSEGGWEKTGTLPDGSAYGACFCMDGRMTVAGGSNPSGLLSSVLTIGPYGTVERLPDLPVPVQQAGACCDGGRAYIVGGLSAEPGYAGVLVLEDSVFVHLCDLPEPIVQPVAFHDGKSLYVWGGYNPLTGTALDYGYRSDGDGWEEIPGCAPGETLTGAASAVIDGILYVAGGTDKGIMDYALPLTGDSVREYQSHEQSWYKFRDVLRRFDPGTQEWAVLGSCPGLARAGASLAATSEGNILNIGGETMPGIRSAGMTAISHLP